MTSRTYISLGIYLQAVFIVAVTGDHSWGYYNVKESQKPDHWVKHYPACEGKYQSPIDIKKSEVSYDSSLGDFTLTGWDTLTPSDALVMENNGHTVKVAVNDNSGIFVEGGGLPNKYQLKQFHIHWGNANAEGSEHLVDGKPYPAEMHFVCYNTKYAASDVLKHRDGLAVLGVFIKIQGNDNENMTAVTQKLSNIPYSDSNKVTLTSVKLRNMLPKNINKFYRYSGSLTTPPCSEAVIWTVFAKPIRISQAQMGKFRRELYQSDRDEASRTGYKLLSNYRPPQPLGSRTVVASDPKMTSSGCTMWTFYVTLVPAIISTFIAV